MKSLGQADQPGKPVRAPRAGSCVICGKSYARGEEVRACPESRVDKAFLQRLLGPWTSRRALWRLLKFRHLTCERSDDPRERPDAPTRRLRAYADLLSSAGASFTNADAQRPARDLEEFVEERLRRIRGELPRDSRVR